MLVNSPRLDRDLIASFRRVIQPVLGGVDEREKESLENNSDIVVIEDNNTMTEPMLVQEEPAISDGQEDVSLSANDELGEEVEDGVDDGGELMGDDSEPKPKGVSEADMQVLSEAQQHWLGVLIESRCVCSKYQVVMCVMQYLVCLLI